MLSCFCTEQFTAKTALHTSGTEAGVRVSNAQMLLALPMALPSAHIDNINSMLLE